MCMPVATEMVMRSMGFFCMQIIDQLQSDSRFEGKLQSPSVSCGAQNLYMRGVFEEETRPNLQKVVVLKT